jgi:hypothetical protein
VIGPPARLRVQAPHLLDRRTFARALAGATAALLAGCGGAPPAPAPPVGRPEAPPPLRIAELTGLLPLAHLRWAVLVKPREIAAVPWLIPPLGRVVPEENLTRFAADVGFDLRQIPDAAVATYAGDGLDGTLYVVRHNGDPTAIERLFRARLVGGEHRALDRADLVRLSGKIGSTPSTLVLAGRDVAAFQFGGAMARGPARVASLYALDKLKKSPTLLAEDPLRALDARLGQAPVRAFALGPFEGELTRGARGLLAGATALGGTVRPSAREGLLVVVAVSGDFASSGPAASHELAVAWDDLARGSFGHLLGLDEPIEKPLATHGTDAVAVAVEIDPGRLARGLASATSARIAEIMR